MVSQHKLSTRCHQPLTLGTQLHITPCVELLPEVAAVKNCFVKPRGGLWTSSYVDSKSAWVDAHQDMFEESRGSAYELSWFLLEPDPAARVLVIDTLDDLREVLAEHLYHPYPGLDLDSMLGAWPDFERIAERWDAMHLTEAGQWRTRLTIPSLYGWDSESTLWFRWCFKDCRRIEGQKAV